jgi:hypothetical protein
VRLSLSPVWLALLPLIALYGFVGAGASQQTQQHPTSQSGPNEPHQGSSNGDPGETRNNSGTDADWTMVGLTVALAFIALAQALLFMRQLRFIEGSIKDAEIVSAAAVQSAEAAKRSADTLAKAERAYVAVHPLGIETISEEGTVALVNILNAGHLPATDTRWFVDWDTDLDPERNNFPIGTLQGSVVAVPGADIRIATTTRHAADLTLIHNSFQPAPKDKWLFVWGLVSYESGFGARSNTYFCHRYNCKAFRDGAIPVDKARYHEHGNKAD